MCTGIQGQGHKYKKDGGQKLAQISARCTPTWGGGGKGVSEVLCSFPFYPTFCFQLNLKQNSNSICLNLYNLLSYSSLIKIPYQNFKDFIQLLLLSITLWKPRATTRHLKLKAFVRLKSLFLMLLLFIGRSFYLLHF